MTITALVPLGTNGFFASHSRLTMSFLLLGQGKSKGAKEAVLLDAGSGVGRLAEPKIAKLLADVHHLDVVLTHYHLDHVCGLPALPAALAAGLRALDRQLQPSVSLFLPGPPLVDADPDVALGNLLTPPLFPSTVERFADGIRTQTYSRCRDLEAVHLATKVRTRRQFHPGGSVGLRFGDQLAYITDTRSSDETAEFVRGVDWLLHEAWVGKEEAVRDPSAVAGHTDCESLRRMAENAGIGRLLPIHHHPSRTAAELRLLHQELLSDHYQLVGWPDPESDADRGDDFYQNKNLGEASLFSVDGPSDQRSSLSTAS